MAILTDIFPIHDITKKGVVIGDNKGAITVCFEMEMPVIYTLGEDDFESMIEKFRTFLENLGENIIVHKQDIFHKEVFSIGNQNVPVNADFIERSYQTHFNERPYLQSKTYLYVTQFDQTKTTAVNFFSKNSALINEQDFIDLVLNASVVLNPYISLNYLDKEDLLSVHSPISKYYNFSQADVEELKDVNFADNSLYVGSKKIKIYTIENLKQFPTENITYCSLNNGLPVSYMFDFSYPLSLPHVCNQYIYIPNQKELSLWLDNRQEQMKSYNVKGANNEAYEDIITFKTKLSEWGCKGAYYHMNIMCFDDTETNIEKRINTAFSNSGFKKKENTLSRKDLFLSGIPGNAVRLALEKDKLMSLLVDLECAAFSIYECNYSDSLTATQGVRLCDRLYGIPFQVDLFDEPKRKGWINNQNAIVLAGSGGGKSFFTNLILLNQYRQGAHVFVIDASFSYKLQTAMHDGVYLTFDDENKITFNPFYMDWLKNAKELFTNDLFNPNNPDNELEQEANQKYSVEQLRYSNYLEDKIAVISGLLAVMTKNEGETLTKFEDNVYRELIYEYFKDRCLTEKTEQTKFDDFFAFAQAELSNILKKSGISDQSFQVPEFLFMLKQFKTGNSLGYLLNSMDDKIKNIENQRFVVIDVSKIRSNRVLFSIVSTLAMDLYNQKVARLPLNVKKILCIDEAWQAISSPEMAMFMKSQVKVIRKYGGQTIFISQELDDFISSEVIKESIINNSSIKIFADMGSFAQKFEPIKKALSISDNNEVKIKSLNKNNRPNAFYKEVCICWEQQGQVYAVEVPTELKAVFETDADEVGKILPQFQKYGVELTAINYADR
jgi:hypothetical protein